MTLIDSSVGGPVTSWTTDGIISGLDLGDGVLFRFHVVAINAIGTSEASTLLGIYAAEIPYAPQPPTMVS